MNDAISHLGCYDCGAIYTIALEGQQLARMVIGQPVCECGGVLRDVSRVPARELAERHDTREAVARMPEAFAGFIAGMDLSGLEEA